VFRGQTSRCKKPCRWLALELRAVVLDQEVEAEPLHQFHDHERLALRGDAVLEGLDDVLVPQPFADFPLGGAFQAGEAGLELGGLGFVEDFQADHAGQLVVAGAPHLGHAALAGPALQLEPLLDVHRGGLALRFAGEELFEFRQDAGHGCVLCPGAAQCSQ